MMPLIVKLGGSLYNTPELPHWLNVLADYSQQQSIIIVPGGGPFADHVRQAQSLYQFNDHAAHHMALIAMKQFGLLLAALEPRCQLFTSNMTTIPRLSVWLTDDSLLLETELKHSWDISSDSLALWLANKVTAQQLILIKCCTILSKSIKQLALDSVIDTGFSTLFKQNPITTKIIHHQDYDDFANITSSINQQQTISLP